MVLHSVSGLLQADYQAGALCAHLLGRTTIPVGIECFVAGGQLVQHECVRLIMRHKDIEGERTHPAWLPGTVSHERTGATGTTGNVNPVAPYILDRMFVKWPGPVRQETVLLMA